MSRHDPRSSHAKTSLIGASKPQRFANTKRTYVFDTLAQQVFCLIIREGFGDPTAICHPDYVKTCSTLLLCQDDSNWSIKTSTVSEIRPRFVVRNMLRHDLRSSYAKTTPIGASNPLRHDLRSSYAKTTPIGASNPLRHAPRSSYAKTTPIGASKPVSEIRPRSVIQNMLRHDPRSSQARTTPIGASKPLRHNPRSYHAKTTGIGASKPLQFANTTRTDVFESLAQQVFYLVIREGHDPRSSHAKTTAIGASKPHRFAGTTQTDVFDSLAQQVFCLVIREVFRDLTAICRLEYVKT
ncbi:hypothetical protein G2W53_041676 [Senna tora]|uniref:Uncharacterized protein n=1 Tax=Senna tora TaxID=362788 RepID=A0A834VZD5_9FABA|nr:hypothetical protein G2W53_041676 [Senna tora]